jgi:hypothetical protein
MKRKTNSECGLRNLKGIDEGSGDVKNREAGDQDTRISGYQETVGQFRCQGTIIRYYRFKEG